MKKTYVSGNLSRKRFMDDFHKTRAKRIANRYKNSYWWERGYQYKNEGTKREHITTVSYTKRDNNINEGKFLRRQANKRIRRMKYDKIENMNYSTYKRVYDYWWKIF